VIWWTSQPSRARSERSAIAELEEASDWLRTVSWKVTDEGVLRADFEITVNGAAVALELTYPGLFPDVPPQIRPKDKVLLSGHQYGVGGELCLEYRPDNWEPTFTGAMMVASAHRLLTGEQPTPDERATVESAHRTTLGQSARGATFRFLLPPEARRAMLTLPVWEPMEAEVTEHLVSGTWLAFPVRAGNEERTGWDASTSMPRFKKRTGYFLRIGASILKHVKADWDFVSTLVAEMKVEAAQDRLVKSDEEMILLLEGGGVFTLMAVVAGDGKRTVIGYQTLDLPEDGARLPAEYARLAEASVAIVGCGSMGSKIASSLARAGVGKFVLIDGDVLLPGNIVRNDLDWTVVGLNKPDGVKRRIERISPSAKITIRRIGLGGQESASSTASALELAGGCDVIVEVTADPEVFNLCGAIARNERKVLVWGKVFAGGIGGIVARLRPDLDPVPHAARRQIIDWCAERDKPVPAGTEIQYGLVLGDDEQPFVADDADVAVIAAHATRLALDALLREETAFLQSAYAVGLRTEWIFEGPFDTWPIVLKTEGAWGPVEDEHLNEELGAFLKEFFPKADGDGSDGK
jgi:molybdopterin/thiamine biosynthesis adenylyltransferase/ubiquitin-protein ligase